MNQPAGTVKAYRVTCQGQYFAHAPDGGRAVTFYDPVEFTIPETVSYSDRRERKIKIVDDKEIKYTEKVIEEANAMQVVNHYVQRYCLPPYLREKYPDVIRMRTCIITKKQIVFIPVEDVRDVKKLPIQDMKESELLHFHAMNDLVTVLDNYNHLGDKKMAVELELAEKATLQDEEAGINDPQSRLMAEPAGMTVGEVTSELGEPEEEKEVDLLS